jgi:hypothetical protein
MTPANHLKDTALYWAVYARMRDLVQYVPVWKTSKAMPVFRAVQPSGGTRVMTGRAGAEAYRTIWKSAVSDHRWTGPRPPTPPGLSAELTRLLTGRPPASGLYLASDLNDAALGEFTWYATATSGRQITFDKDAQRRAEGKPPTLTQTGFQAAMAVSRIFEYRVPPGLPFANLSLGANSGRALLDALVADTGGGADRLSAGEKQNLDVLRSAFRKAGYVSAEAAYTASDDYSFCRAVGQSVRDLMPGCRGLKVTSVRSDAGTVFRDASGDNLILFGGDGHVLNDLTPVYEWAFVRQPGSPMQTIKTPL